jgi:hypothetical protein
VGRHKEVRAVLMKSEAYCVSECLPTLRTLVIRGIRTTKTYFDNDMILTSITATCNEINMRQRTLITLRQHTFLV